MHTVRPWLASIVLLTAPLLGGCEDLLIGDPLEPMTGCSDDVHTCQGGDCYAECVCENRSVATCEQRCEGGPQLRVADLDEDAWSAAWARFEDEVLDRTNAARAERGCCGDEGCFAPAPALHLDARLRSAARLHAKDMADNGYFDHDNLEGRSPFDRMREAGFDGCAMGENIAEGQPTPQDVVQDWLGSPGHCANMRQPMFDALGVGYYERPDETAPPVWVQAFGG